MDQDELFDYIAALQAAADAEAQLAAEHIAALQAALARDHAAQARAERACSYAAALAAVGEAPL